MTAPINGWLIKARESYKTINTKAKLSSTLNEYSKYMEKKSTKR